MCHGIYLRTLLKPPCFYSMSSLMNDELATKKLFSLSFVFFQTASSPIFDLDFIFKDKFSHSSSLFLDPMSVVDPKLKLIGVEKLRVIDASIMPRVIGGNTNAPSIMIGERGADFILKQYGQIKKGGSRNKDEL